MCEMDVRRISMAEGVNGRRRKGKAHRERRGWKGAIRKLLRKAKKEEDR